MKSKVHKKSDKEIIKQSKSKIMASYSSLEEAYKTAQEADEGIYGTENACQAYEKIGKFCLEEAQRTLKRGAEIASSLEDYSKAIELYTLMFNFDPSNLMLAAICALADDDCFTAHDILGNTRFPINDYATLHHLIITVTTKNVEQFSIACSKYDKRCGGLKPHVIMLLLRIKNMISEAKS